MSETCARKGCRKRLPRPALLAGDPFCSAVCCRLEHGLDGEASEGRWGSNVCLGCGCEFEDRTAGCDVCDMRHLKRAGKARAAA